MDSDAAALALLSAPFGTLLGIFSLLHLTQPTAIAQFEAAKASRTAD